MTSPRIRLDLVPADSGRDHDRVWALRVDGADAGTLRASRRGDEVEVRVEVDQALTRRGVARGAIGRMLGLAPFGSEVEYIALIDARDAGATALARAMGFAPTGRSRESRDVWTRPAPRSRAARDDPMRFLDGEGRIDRYPQRDTERLSLLTWVTAQALPAGIVVTEAEVNEMLAPFAPGGDVAVLRRYLVDHELVERTRSGSEYLRLV